MRSVGPLAALAVLALIAAGPAAAQTIDLGQILPEGEASAAGRIIQLVALLTVLSLAPGLLITMTSFTRFIVALSFLRSGLGVPSTPANLILISLALFMTLIVMQSNPIVCNEAGTPQGASIAADLALRSRAFLRSGFDKRRQGAVLPMSTKGVLR